MIKKYVYGEPFPTQAVVNDISASADTLPYFETDGKGGFIGAAAAFAATAPSTDYIE